jgi:hypothetical protein
MTPAQYRAALARLGSSVASKATASALGITIRTSQKYASGELPVPQPIVVILKLLEERQGRNGA